MSDFMVNNAMPILIGLGVAFVACLGLIVFGWFQWQRETNRKLAAFRAAPTDTTNAGVEPAAPVAPIAAPVAVTPVVETSQPESLSVPVATAPTMAPPATADAATPTALLDALQLLRDPATGQLLVGIGSDVYASARDVRRPEHQRLLLGSARDLLIFLGQTRAAAALPAGPAPTADIDAASAPIQPVTVLRPNPAPAEKLHIPSMNPFQQLKVIKQLAATPETPELTIAQQIDNLLQDLTAVSALTGRGLRVAGTPDGLVSFELDGASYSDIDAVPDPAARDLLRSAVKRWEAQAG